jgi:hypothetical protein
MSLVYLSLELATLCKICLLSLSLYPLPCTLGGPIKIISSTFLVSGTASECGAGFQHTFPISAWRPVCSFRSRWIYHCCPSELRNNMDLGHQTPPWDPTQRFEGEYLCFLHYLTFNLHPELRLCTSLLTYLHTLSVIHRNFLFWYQNKSKWFNLCWSRGSYLFIPYHFYWSKITTFTYSMIWNHCPFLGICIFFNCWHIIIWMSFIPYSDLLTLYLFFQLTFITIFWLEPHVFWPL